MKRPTISLENHQSVYEFYRNHKPNPLTRKLGIMAFAAAFRPYVHYAESAREAIRDLRHDGTRFIYAPNHVSDYEQYVMASLVHRDRQLRPTLDNMLVVGKQSLFQNWFLRRAVDAMGAMPAIRTGDERDEQGNITDGQRVLLKATKEGLISTSVDRGIRGGNLLIFAEGKRNKVDHRTVQKLYDGIGHIACGISKEAGVATLPVGIYYGEPSERRIFRPTVFVGRPIEGPFTDVGEVLQPLRGEMQLCLDSAIELRQAA